MNNHSSRRDFLAGGLLTSTAFLAACAGNTSTTGLPGPRWPTDSTARPMPAPSAPPVASGPAGVLPRSAWTRAGVARPNEIFEMRGISRITVHHDGMPPASLSTNTDVARRIEQIRRAHTSDRGWADIGYHYVVDPAGRIWEARSARFQGAHVKDNNEHNLGILVLGNFDAQTPTPAALDALDRFVVAQMSANRVALGAVFTHQEIKPTACPGQSLQRYMVSTRRSGGQLARLASSSRLG